MYHAPRVIFIGTSDFATASLTALMDADINIVAVITASDKPQGRGKKMGVSPVKRLAVHYELPTLQPVNLKSPKFLKELKRFDAHLQVVVAFRMLPETVWNMPPLGTFNLHASLLPQYRGAAPIHWAIINGEKETGVTTFFLKHKIDTGPIIFQEKEPIYKEDTTGDLHTRLMNRGAKLVVKTVHAIIRGHYPKKPQYKIDDLKSAPKIFKTDCNIHWHQPTQKIIHFIRGLAPYPAAWTMIHDKTVKIFNAKISKENRHVKAGLLATDGKNYLSIGASDGAIDILELQQEGRKRMLIKEFLRGYSWKKEPL